MKHNFQERKENRINYALEMAEKSQHQSNMLYTESARMYACIPPGQPILIGHYSEKSDRNFRNKAWNKLGQSVQKQEAAKYYADKAEMIANNNSIFSDDPEALVKLRDKLSGLERNQDFMKKANVFLKKRDKAGFLTLPTATPELWDEISSLSRFGGPGYARFELSNNNSEIRRVKQRIADMERMEATPPRDEIVKEIRILENREANRLQIFFGSKPPEEVRQQLKKRGFKYAPSQNAWQRHLNNSSFFLGKEIVQSLPDDVAEKLKTPASLLEDNNDIIYLPAA
ncbi:DUF3560 domain-containing protein [Chitinophaga sp. CF418]|uniref:DUF3560 domain-containing protein n=1 Tax=Chitinophaga sp. CF418 TaxID=1855287 RepID=UPI000920ED45|nr:DUF3560 domain-containing protein [Chitinophaga sp. CF418]SHN45566.1 protein of unknown function [Chitinophaga sp. CF418]